MIELHPQELFSSLTSASQVAEWAARQQLDISRGTGRFASQHAWALAVERRAAAAPAHSLLQDLLEVLDHHVTLSLKPLGTLFHL